MRSVFLGLGLKYDAGSDPSVGLNKAGTVLEVHKNEAGLTLYYRRSIEQVLSGLGADQPQA
jgi:hypothetical protein